MAWCRLSEDVAREAVIGEGDSRGGGPVVDLVDARGTDRQRERVMFAVVVAVVLERVVGASGPLIVMPATVTVLAVPTFLSVNVARCRHR